MHEMTYVERDKVTGSLWESIHKTTSVVEYTLEWGCDAIEC